MDQLPTPTPLTNNILSEPNIETIPRLSIEEAKLKASQNIN